MARGVELATAYVSLAVETSSIPKQIGQGFAAGTKLAASAGRSMGKAMATGFAAEKGPDFEKLAHEAEKADAQVAASAQKVAKVRKSAAEQVEIAEMKIVETREKSIARDKDVIASERALKKARQLGDVDAIAYAEEHLAAARQRVKPTSADLAAEARLKKIRDDQVVSIQKAEGELKGYQSAQKNANETLRDAERAAKEAESATEKTGSAFSRLGTKVKAAIKNDFNNAFGRIERDGENAADEIERDFKRAGDDAARGFSSSFKGGFAGVATGLVSYLGIDQVLGFGKSSFTGAADLQQSVGAVTAVFKESSDQVLAWGEAADQSLGMSANSYNTLATTLGAQLKNSGIEDYTNQTNDLITLGADLSAQFGGSTTEAVEALSSAMRGERDPIERYGISLNQAAIDAKAAELGFAKVDGQFDKNAQTQATLALITEQSADAQGAFSRETGTTANTLQRLTAYGQDLTAEIGKRLTPAFDKIGGWLLDKGIPALEEFGTSISSLWDLMVNGNFDGNLFGLEEDSPIVGNLFDLRDALIDLKDQWGEAISQIDFGAILDGAKEFGDWLLNDGIPALTDFVGVLAEAPGWIQENKAWLTVLGIGLTAAGTAAWVATGGLTAVGLGIKGVFLAISTGIKSIPVIGWIIAGITLLVAALTWFFTQTEVGKEIWAKVWGAIKTAALAVAEWFMNTAVPWLQQAWNAIASGAIWLYENALKPAWEGIRIAIAAVVGWVMGTAVPWLQSAWDVIATAATWLWQSVLKPAWDGILIAISTVITWITGTAVPWLQTAWTAIAAAATWLYQNIISPIWTAIKIAIAVVITAVVLLAQAWAAFFRNVLAPVFTWLYNNVILPVWNGIKTAISAVVAWFQNVAWPFLQATITRIQIRFEQFKAALQIAWRYIQFYVINPVIAWFQNTALPFIRNTINLIQMRFDQFRLGLAIIWAFIRNTIINPVVAWFQGTVQPAFQRVLSFIKARFEDFKTGLKVIWDFVKNNIINPVVVWFEDTVIANFKRGLDALKSAFTKTKDAIGTAWDKLKAKVREPVKAVITTVIKPVADTYDKVAGVVGAPKINFNPANYGFASGGILPGYSPGRDNFHFVDPTRGVSLGLAGGEPIMRPEFGRAVGKGWIDRMNSAARTRGVSGVRDAMGFASGGVFPGGSHAAAGGAFDWLKSKAQGGKDWLSEAWDNINDFIADPKKGFTNVTSGLLGEANLGSTQIAKMLTTAVNKLSGAMADKVLGISGPDASGGTWTGPVGGGKGGSLSQTLALARSMGLVLTSSGRRGARTAQNGLVSLHALGRAHDYAGSSGAMMRFFNAVDARFRPTELLYSPAGARNLHRSGRRYPNHGATLRNHYSHVHVGFANGGVFEPLKGMNLGTKPFLHDRGGWHLPGELSVNQTQKPEAVLTHAQWETIRGAAENGTASGTTVVQVTPPTSDDPGMWGRRIADTLDLVGAAAAAGGEL